MKGKALPVILKRKQKNTKTIKFKHFLKISKTSARYIMPVKRRKRLAL